MRAIALVLAAGTALTVTSSAWAAGIITTIAGGGPAPNISATDQPLPGATSVLFDPAGNLYISDVFKSRVYRREAASGVLVAVAGSQDHSPFQPCGSDLGDGGPATAACFFGPSGMALDGAGNLYVADWGNNRVRRIDASTGTVTTVAGGGSGPLGDGGPATLAMLQGPNDVAVDDTGNLFISEIDGRRIRRVDAATGVITTLSTAFLDPRGIAVRAGLLYVADGYATEYVYSLPTGGGSPTVVAGNGTAAFCGDGGPATAACLYGPSDVAFDGDGNLLIADNENHRVRRVDATTGVIETIAGNGASTCPVDHGDGGPALAACLESVVSLAVDAADDVVVADVYARRVRRIDAGTGVIDLFAGNGTFSYCGDDGPATGACLFGPYGITRDAGGNLFIADFNNARIRKVDAATGVMTSVAVGDYYGSADGAFTGVTDIVADLDGNVLFPDIGNVIRRLNIATGVIETLYGTPPGGYCGDGGDAHNACFSGLFGLAVDQAGNIYVADSFNARVRRIDGLTHIVTTVAGNGTYDFCGDGGPATQACVAPGFVALDPAGNLYITDINAQRVRRVDAQTQIITTIAGGGSGLCVEGGPATSGHCMSFPQNLTADVFGNVFVVDDYRVWRIDAAADTISTAAGTNSNFYCGDGGPADQACIAPRSVVVDPDGSLIIADTGNGRIRRVACDGPDSDGDGICDAYDFDEVQGMSLRSASVQRRGFKGRVDVDVDVDTAAFSPVGDPSAFFAQVHATGFTVRTTASDAPPELAEVVGVPLTPATCRFTPTDAAVPSRVRCKVNGIVRARVRLSQRDAAGRYRLVGRAKLPRVGIPSGGILRVAVGLNGVSGKDYEVAAADCMATTGRRPALICTGAP
jgi:sugar lactone lactonase YvrE